MSEQSEGRSEESPDGHTTRYVHEPRSRELATEPQTPAIYQSSAFELQSAEQAARVMDFELEEHVYSRLTNPTVMALEDRLAAVSDGTGAVATSSGMAAYDLVTQALSSQGSNIVAGTPVFENTYMHLEHMCPRRGVEGRLLPATDYGRYEELIDEETAFVHLDTIGNPNLVVPDMERVADVAHDHGVPLVVDNTLASPAVARPADHGADVIWESTTKWIDGGGMTVGGAVVDCGSFPWQDYPEKYREIGGDSPAYDDMCFASKFGDAAFAKAVRFRFVRDLGNQQSPLDAWLTLQGMETLPIRMRRHCENAAIVAEFLRDHDGVDWVAYPGLESHDTHEEASKYLHGGYGSVVSFGLEGGYRAGKAVVESTELIKFVMNLGDTKSMVVHPASSTHKDWSDEALAATGVTPDLVRLAVGVEDPADIVADLDRAITRSTVR